ncbi:MAG: hypothetical protein ACRBBV_10345 [Paracoccaceae bacterium]
MEQKTPSKNRAKPADSREDRLKAALKANMARRKAQARARSASDMDKTQDETGPARGDIDGTP